jgi:hypothetical protein
MVKKVTINLDQETYDQLRWYSFDRKLPMSEVIRKGIILSMKEDFKPVHDRVSKIIAGKNPTPIPPKSASKTVEYDTEKFSGVISEPISKPVESLNLADEFHPMPKGEK